MAELLCKLTENTNNCVTNTETSEIIRLRGGKRMRDEVLDLTIIIPAYNPGEKLEKVVKGLRDRGFHDIIVVNDGSDEEHIRIFTAVEGETTVIHCSKNRGKPKAMKIAFAFCRENRSSSQGVIIVDWDNQYHSDDVYACGKALLEHHGHLILGCRNFHDDRISFKSKFGNGIMKSVFRIFCGIKVSDTHAGLRAIDASVLPQVMEIQGERYEHDMNMLLEAKLLEIPITEVLIRTLSA